MAREYERLRPNAAKAITAVGRHADGNGLYLSISPNGGRRWVFLKRIAGKRVEIGLGSARTVSLATARRLARACNDAVAEGKDPRSLRPRGGRTFGGCAEDLVKALQPTWRNPKHAAQWFMTLLGRTPDGAPTRFDYCAALRKKPVAEVTADDVVAVLRPLWSTKRETAVRLRGRIEQVLDVAKAEGHRSGDNPARWKESLRPRQSDFPTKKRQERKHHVALPFADIPKFMAQLRQCEGITARALEFTILTAARTSETIGATWDEITLDFTDVTLRDQNGREFTISGPCWIVPGSRMKAGRPHCVPLAPRAVEILMALRDTEGEGGLIFRGRQADRPLSNMAMAMLLRRLVAAKTTVHGFRSCFRDWCAETTSFPNIVSEAALAHVVKDRTERAYRRGVLFDKRRPLMEAWSEYSMG